MKNWQQINIARIRYINYANMVVRRVFKQVREDVVRGYLASGVISIPQADLKQAIQGAYEEIYTSTGVAFALMQAETLKSRMPGLSLKDEETMGGVWYRHMLNFARTRCADKITSSTRTAYNNIVRVTQSVIEQGAGEGWGPARVAREIMKKQGSIDNYSALRIARTEVVGASNEGSHTGAGSLGVQVRKIWLATAHGDRREGHWDLNGTSVDYNDTFTVEAEDGTIDHMLYPHDPGASAGNVIQCRCGITYEPVNSYIDQLLGEG